MRAEHIALLAEFGLLPEQRASARTLPAKRSRAGLKPPRLRLLGRRKRLRIYLVDSTKARLLYADWTMGGHDAVYSDFIPRGEVWIADELGPFERKLTTLHELHERRLMLRGMPYDLAHHQATQIEAHYRENGGRGLAAALRKEDGGAGGLPRLRGGKARHSERRLVYRRPWDAKARGGKGGWRPFIRATQRRSGAYVIRTDGGKAYVGSSDSGRLYRTLVRHFEQWDRNEHYWDRGYNRSDEAPGETFDRNRVEVAVLLCPARQARTLEADLMRRLNPSQNEAAPQGHAGEVPSTTQDVVPF